MSVEELLDMATEKGHKQLALTDVNSTSAWVDFIRFAEKGGIAPAVGIDFRNGAKQCYVGIALNAEGRHELNRFLSEHIMDKKAFPAQAPEMENCVMIYPFGEGFSNSRFWVLGSEDAASKTENSELKTQKNQ